MDNLKEKILNDLKQAMQSGDAKKRDTLRMLTSAIKDEEIKQQKREQGLNNDEVISVVARSLKQRKDSITEYEKGGREDLAEIEKQEIKILQIYMPEQLSIEIVQEEVKKIIQDLGAISKADFGKVMGTAMAKLKGKADGQIVKQAVEKELNA
ncbi:GatB/YqeY domain-containing protein [Candidatus Falkowbacteria bacterium]|jgi:uncharacterized protein|nr:GatB/YqeY domain-containing protein [Candidatus Falkowbacteria bacterium]MBT4439405.1 GatB/YqeY domain-containing protein [Elusimicrobiaceae bacterium]